MIRIYEGDARDIPAIMPIMEAAFDPAYGEAWTASQCMATLALPYSQLWLAEHEDSIVGFAITRWVMDEEELLMIGVDEKMQKKNIGTKLVETILRNSASVGRKTIFLEVRDGNKAIKFYYRNGFEVIGKRKLYYTGIENQKYDAITMARQV